jgi:hypothetical protein
MALPRVLFSLALLALASAHNYVQSPSRALIASVAM